MGLFTPSGGPPILEVLRILPLQLRFGLGSGIGAGFHQGSVVVEVPVEGEAGLDQFFRQFFKRMKLDRQARRVPECERGSWGKASDGVAAHLLGNHDRKKSPRRPGQGNVGSDEGPGQTFLAFEFPVRVVHLFFEPGCQPGAIDSPAAADYFRFKLLHQEQGGAAFNPEEAHDLVAVQVARRQALRGGQDLGKSGNPGWRDRHVGPPGWSKSRPDSNLAEREA